MLSLLLLPSPAPRSCRQPPPPPAAAARPAPRAQQPLAQPALAAHRCHWLQDQPAARWRCSALPPGLCMQRWRGSSGVAVRGRTTPQRSGWTKPLTCALVRQLTAQALGLLSSLAVGQAHPRLHATRSVHQRTMQSKPEGEHHSLQRRVLRASAQTQASSGCWNDALPCPLALSTGSTDASAGRLRRSSTACSCATSSGARAKLPGSACARSHSQRLRDAPATLQQLLRPRIPGGRSPAQTTWTQSPRPPQRPCPPAAPPQTLSACDSSSTHAANGSAKGPPHPPGGRCCGRSARGSRRASAAAQSPPAGAAGAAPPGC